MGSQKISFGIDKNMWIRLCEKCDKWLFRANYFGKKKIQPDTASDKTQQIDAEGFVRARPKREWDLSKMKDKIK